MSIGLLRLFLDDFLHAWVRPPDAAAWMGLALAALFTLMALSRGRVLDAFLRIRTGVFLSFAAVTAALLSLAYTHFYLRGGPRIIDATSYFLEGRAIASGHFAWETPDPSASFRGRFLYAHDASVGGIFPPGFPLLLAVGFLFHAPLLVGPALAAGIVVATYALARILAEDWGTVAAESSARVAALASIFSVALRYHTSDTMSHAAAALGVTGALVFALRGRSLGRARPFAWAGLFLGFVAATRFASLLPILATTALIAIVSPLRLKAFTFLVIGMIPGWVLLLASQAAITGSALQSTQLAYYAVSDGPPGCFRYGFGKGIGCLFEHGDFVKARLQDGHTLAESLETTAFRLKFHLLDALNVELLAVVLLPLVALSALRRAPGRYALLTVALQIAAYAPFYFDGSYPGGGGRFYADVLPLEHALVALLLVMRLRPTWTLRFGFALVSLMLLGFAFRGAKDHDLLRERDGGRPAFEPSVVREAGLRDGLLFVDSDAAFNLAHDPRARAGHGLVVARIRNDAHDWILWSRLGRPTTYRYTWGEHRSSVEPFLPKVSDRFEAEADWPPLAQSGGYAIPYWPPCASEGRGLVLIPTTSRATAEIELFVPEEGDYVITPNVVDRGMEARGELMLRSPSGESRLSWEWLDGREEVCRSLGPQRAHLAAGRWRLLLAARGGEIALDATDLRRADGPR